MFLEGLSLFQLVNYQIFSKHLLSAKLLLGDQKGSYNLSYAVYILVYFSNICITKLLMMLWKLEATVFNREFVN